MTTDEMINVLQAYKDGKKIECCSIYSVKGDWEVCTNPIWDFYHNVYRVKPESQYRPFKTVKEVMDAIKAYGDWVIDNGIYRRIDKVSCLGAEGLCVTLSGMKDWGINMMPRIKDMKFADGTPFGVLEE